MRWGYRFTEFEHGYVFEIWAMTGEDSLRRSLMGYRGPSADHVTTSDLENSFSTPFLSLPLQMLCL